MDLIIGGAYQGKKEYVRQTYHFSGKEMGDGAVVDFDKANTYPCLYNVHLLIKRWMMEGRDPLSMAEELSCVRVLILDEIGCGIIPMEALERRYRECVGQTGCLLAARADQVIRLCCGIPVKIK